MSYKIRTRRTPPYVQKIVFDNNIKQVKRKSPKLCPDLNKIEEIVNNFYKNSPSYFGLAPMEIDDPVEYALYCSSYGLRLNNIPCELIS
ncbi:hypothetical protein C1645_823992 [Glomus cerebriforme]|uniref:Uncharacterized protein n=1 Tax=Glomus cerebriforme TaxID=658196 RepID=A0A397SVC8_9GLOM|nr:hypothetical protein C1645_823992 [Glomus cerebriforme]